MENKSRQIATLATFGVFALFFILLKSCNSPSPAPKNNYIKLTPEQRFDSIKTARQITIEDSLAAIVEQHYRDSTEKANAKTERMQEKEDSLEEVKWERTKAGRIWKSHQDWDKDDCEKLAKNEFWIGMTYEMLVEERGRPNHVTTSNYGDGNEYQACWDDYDTSCFYFGEDHIITEYN